MADEHFLDRLTSIDDILRSINSMLSDIKTFIEPSEKPPTDIEITEKHLPFFSEGTLTPGIIVELQIRSDNQQGLGSAGRTGWISNDGIVNDLTYRISDGNGKSEWITLKPGEIKNYERDGDIWFDKLELVSELGTDYRCEFTR